MFFIRKRFCWWQGLAALCLGGGVLLQAAAASLDRTLNLQIQSQQEAAQSQAKIDKLADQTEELIAAYKNAVAELDNLRNYNGEVEKLVAGQRQELSSIEQQLEEIDNTEGQVEPLVNRMLASLDDFVKSDMPFQTDERRARLQQLHAAVDDPGLPVAEKFRQVMAVYRIEMSYGRSIATYRGKLPENGSARDVDFLRLGRVALLYRTLDGKDSGYWDNRQHRWIAAGAEYSRAVADGLRIARREAAPDLIDAPVPAPTQSHD
jgi:hypothetical protein